MKRFFLSLLISVFVLGGFAQKGKVNSALSLIDANNLTKAKEAIDAALVHDKTVDYPKTYYVKGRLAQASYEAKDENLNLYTDPLMVAYASYQKAMELDEKSQIDKLIIIQFPVLSNDFLEWAINEFEAENYDKALSAFEKLLEIQGSEKYMGAIDTAVIFNAGLTAYNAKDYDKAIMYYDKCIEMDYEGGTPYLRKYLTYSDMGDLENAEKTLVEAFQKFPEDNQVLLQLIDFYLVNGMDKEAFEYITKAKEKDDSNFSLYWAEGVLYMKQDKYDEAIEALSKSIEFKPDMFDTQFNMGVCYYNKASSMFDAANDIMDNTEYNAAVEKAMDVFGKALPYMEKARELKPDDMATLTSLRELYYRLKMMDKYEEVKARISELEG